MKVTVVQGTFGWLTLYVTNTVSNCIELYLYCTVIALEWFGFFLLFSRVERNKATLRHQQRSKGIGKSTTLQCTCNLIFQQHKLTPTAKPCSLCRHL